MKIIIGTHHKTGTNFFSKFLRKLSLEKKISVWDRGSSPEAANEPPDWQIYFDHWSKWVIDIDNYEFKGIHSVRHPMSLIYSATLYHCTSKELWLHDKKDMYNGRSYADMINSFPTVEEKLMFEMKGSSRNAILRMLEVAPDSRFCNVRLENISHDREMADLRRAFEFIGISESDADDWLSIAKTFSLSYAKALPKHSTTGVSDDWKKYFKDDVELEYRRIFGEAELTLGYD